MNSVSMPSRPVSCARCARPVTVVSTVAMGVRLWATRRAARRTAGSAGRVAGVRRRAVRILAARGRGGLGAPRWRLVGPVAVLVVVGARLVLGVAVALALDADTEDHVQQPDRHAGGHDRDAALPARLAAAARDDRDDARDDDRDGKPDADEAHHAASAAAARRAGEKRSTSSAAVTRSPGAARPTVEAR